MASSIFLCNVVHMCFFYIHIISFCAACSNSSNHLVLTLYREMFFMNEKSIYSNIYIGGESCQIRCIDDSIKSVQKNYKCSNFVLFAEDKTIFHWACLIMWEHFFSEKTLLHNTRRIYKIRYIFFASDQNPLFFIPRTSYNISTLGKG